MKNNIEQLSKELIDLCGNYIFPEHYSHSNCMMWKIMNPYTEYASDKIVLCQVDMEDGVQRALTIALAILVQKQAIFMDRQNRKSIITISNYDKKQFFFTTDHCQKHKLGAEWVPRSSTIPQEVATRESLPSGIVRCKEDYIKVFLYDHNEIPNPQPEYQA